MIIRRLPWLMLGLLLAAGFAGLGRWQLGRALEKEVAQKQAQQVLGAREQRDLAWALAQDGDAPVWVAGRGHFLSGPSLLLDNQRRGDQVGIRVYRAFQPESGGASLLVDLGWLALPGNRSMPVLHELPASALELRGLLDRPPSPGLAMGPEWSDAGDGRWLLTRLDLPALSAGLGTPLAAQVLRLDPALPLGYPRDLALLANTLPPEKHRGYALQWFGLAFASVITTFLLFLRRPRHD